MKIDVRLKLKEENILLGEEKLTLAAGWVELEDCLKFPITVQSYRDKKDGKLKHFVSYPWKKSGDAYENIIYPHDRQARKEIEECVLEAMKDELRKGMDLPEPEDVRVTLLEEEGQNSQAPIRGIATLRILGMTVKGILVRESAKGLFIQMPQRGSGKEQKDLVYGTNTGIQTLIRDEVIYAYKKELELKKQEGKDLESPGQSQGRQEPESIRPEGKPMPEVRQKEQKCEQNQPKLK